jgi:hypothetical protein
MWKCGPSGVYRVPEKAKGDKGSHRTMLEGTGLGGQGDSLEEAKRICKENLSCPTREAEEER